MRFKLLMTDSSLLKKSWKLHKKWLKKANEDNIELKFNGSIDKKKTDTITNTGNQRRIIAHLLNNAINFNESDINFNKSDSFVMQYLPNNSKRAVRTRHGSLSFCTYYQFEIFVNCAVGFVYIKVWTVRLPMAHTQRVI